MGATTRTRPRAWCCQNHQPIACDTNGQPVDGGAVGAGSPAEANLTAVSLEMNPDYRYAPIYVWPTRDRRLAPPEGLRPDRPRGAVHRSVGAAVDGVPAPEVLGRSRRSAALWRGAHGHLDSRARRRVRRLRPRDGGRGRAAFGARRSPSASSTRRTAARPSYSTGVLATASGSAWSCPTAALPMHWGTTCRPSRSTRVIVEHPGAGASSHLRPSSMPVPAWPSSEAPPTPPGAGREARVRLHGGSPVDRARRHRDAGRLRR